MPNFNSLADVEVTEKFAGGVVVVVVGDGFQVATVSNLKASCLELL